MCIGALAVDTPDEVRDTFYQLERDVPALYLFNGLYLTQEQYRQLARFVREMEAIDKTTQKEISDLENKYVDRIIEDARAGRVDDRLIARVKEEQQKIQSERAKELSELLQETYEILTPSQQSVLDTFKPCFVPEQDFTEPVRVGEVDDRYEVGEKVLDRLRTIPEMRLPVTRRSAVENLALYVMHKRHVTYSDENKKKMIWELDARLDEMMPQLREMNEADYALEKIALVDQLLPLDDEDVEIPDPDVSVFAPEELTGDAKYKLQTYILNPGIQDVITSRAAGARVYRRPRYRSPEMNDLEDAFQAVETVQLIDKLHLQSGQLAAVIPVIREAVWVKKEQEDYLLMEMKEALTMYELLREELLLEQLNPGTESNANQYHIRVRAINEQERVQALKQWEEKLDAHLSWQQVNVLINPQSDDASTDVNRAAANTARAKTMLSNVFVMSPLVFDERKDAIALDYVRGCLNEEDLEHVDVYVEAIRIVEIMEEARTMPGDRFREKRDALAQQCLPRLNLNRPVSYGSNYDGDEPLPVLDQGTELLFSDLALHVLEKEARE